jgi:UDP-glucose 4-epimerase
LTSLSATSDTPACIGRRECSVFFSSLDQPAVALYSGSKIVGENIGRLYHDRYGIQAVSLRYSSVYGERQHQRALNTVYIIDTYEQIKRGERPIIPDDGLEVHDYIHAADVARANAMAMESDVSKESFNIVTGVSTTLNRLVEIILAEAGSDLRPEYRTDPNKVGGAPSKTLKLSNQKITSMFGWRSQISIEDGISRVIQWRKAQVR